MLSLLKNYFTPPSADLPEEEWTAGPMYTELKPIVPPNLLEPCRTLIARYEVEDTIHFRMSLDEDEERAWTLLKTYLQLIVDLPRPDQEAYNIARNYVN